MMKLHLVGIELHGGEVRYSLHRTPDSAKAKVADFAREWWNDLFGAGPAGEPMPADDDQLIAAYFERAIEREGESYIITEVAVED